MHEFSIAQQVVEVVQDAAAKAGGSKVSEIHLRIGELSFIAEEQLRFAIGEMSRGTVLEGAELTIFSEPGVARCRSCGTEETVSYERLRAAVATLAICARCGGAAELSGGSGCTVENIIVEVPEEA
ncbi:MAG: hydrogenase maturation nickel metallochaperone HypA [Methanobacteriota archaeon]